MIREWIKSGAPWPEQRIAATHWAYVKPVRPAVPKAAANPIDAFVRTKLAEKGLPPSPEADRVTQMRRVHYDLLGLPPAPEERLAVHVDLELHGQVEGLRIAGLARACPDLGLERVLPPPIDHVCLEAGVRRIRIAGRQLERLGGIQAPPVVEDVLAADGEQAFYDDLDVVAAAEAGIREQDIVIAVEGKPVGSSEELVVAVDSYDPGDTITVEVVRDGRSREFRATLDRA